MDKQNVVYSYRMAYYSAMKKNEILPFATSCMDLEGIMLREINQTEKDKYHMISRVSGMKATTTTQTKVSDTETDR